jgi:osmotically-inducible protein OsmY
MPTKIKTALYKDKLVKGTQVEVNSLNGVVQLSGFVDSADAKARAGEIASNTKGVVAKIAGKDAGAPSALRAEI